MLVNLTPHPVRVYKPDTPDTVRDLTDGLLVEIPSAGPPARLAETNLGARRQVGHDGVQIPVEDISYGSAADLPPRREGVYLIVSLPLALAVRGRDDLLVPYLPIRNTEGTVVGCRSLARPC